MASIITKNNALVSGILGEQFQMEMMFPQRSKEETKTSLVLPFSLSVLIQIKQDNMKDIGSRNNRVETKKKIFHQRHTPGQH